MPELLRAQPEHRVPAVEADARAVDSKPLVRLTVRAAEVDVGEAVARVELRRWRHRRSAAYGTAERDIRGPVHAPTVAARRNPRRKSCAEPPRLGVSGR